MIKDNQRSQEGEAARAILPGASRSCSSCPSFCLILHLGLGSRLVLQGEVKRWQGQTGEPGGVDQSEQQQELRGLGMDKVGRGQGPECDIGCAGGAGGRRGQLRGGARYWRRFEEQSLGRRGQGGERDFGCGEHGDGVPSAMKPRESCEKRREALAVKRRRKQQTENAVAASAGDVTHRRSATAVERDPTGVTPPGKRFCEDVPQHTILLQTTADVSVERRMSQVSLATDDTGLMLWSKLDLFIHLLAPQGLLLTRMRLASLQAWPLYLVAGVSTRDEQADVLDLTICRVHAPAKGGARCRVCGRCASSVISGAQAAREGGACGHWAQVREAGSAISGARAASKQNARSSILASLSLVGFSGSRLDRVVRSFCRWV